MKATFTNNNQRRHSNKREWSHRSVLLLLILTLSEMGWAAGADGSVASAGGAVNTTINKFSDAFPRDPNETFTRTELRFSEASFARGYQAFTKDILLKYSGLTPTTKETKRTEFMFIVVLAASGLMLVISLVYLLIIVLIYINKSFSCVFKTIGKLFCCCMTGKTEEERLEQLHRLLDRQALSQEDSIADKYRSQNLIILLFFLVSGAVLYCRVVDRGITRSNIALENLVSDSNNGYRSANNTWIGLNRTVLLLDSLSKEVLLLNSTLAYDYTVPQKLESGQLIQSVKTAADEFTQSKIASCRNRNVQVVPDFINNLVPGTLFPQFDTKVEGSVNYTNGLIDQLKELKTTIFTPLNTLIGSGPAGLAKLSQDLANLKQNVSDAIGLVQKISSPFNQIKNHHFSVHSDRFFLLFTATCVLLIVILLVSFVTTCLNFSKPKGQSCVVSCFIAITKNVLRILLVLCANLIAAASIIFLLLAKQSVDGCAVGNKVLHSNDTTATLFQNEKIVPLLNACAKNKTDLNLTALVADKAARDNLVSFFNFFDAYKEDGVRELRYVPFDINSVHEPYRFLDFRQMVKGKFFVNNPLEEPQTIVDTTRNSGVLNCVWDDWTINGTCRNYNNRRYYWHLGNSRLGEHQPSCLRLNSGESNLVSNSAWFNRYTYNHCTQHRSVVQTWRNLNTCIRDLQLLIKNLRKRASQIAAESTGNGYTAQNVYNKAKESIQLKNALLDSIRLAQGPSPEAQSEESLEKKHFKPVEVSLDCRIVRESLLNFVGNGCFRAARPLATQALIVFWIVPLVLALSCYLGSFMKQAVIDLKVKKKAEKLDVDVKRAGDRVSDRRRTKDVLFKDKKMKKCELKPSAEKKDGANSVLDKELGKL